MKIKKNLISFFQKFTDIFKDKGIEPSMKIREIPADSFLKSTNLFSQKIKNIWIFSSSKAVGIFYADDSAIIYNIQNNSITSFNASQKKL